jgi:hypothetical protein
VEANEPRWLVKGRQGGRKERLAWDFAEAVPPSRLNDQLAYLTFSWKSGTMNSLYDEERKNRIKEKGRFGYEATRRKTAGEKGDRREMTGCPRGPKRESVWCGRKSKEDPKEEDERGKAARSIKLA